jgi:3-oxosteroid 1-dehydrogenase
MSRSTAPNAADLTFDATADVVVVGSGGAGLSAALRALSAGAEVLVLEKAPSAGGTTNKAHGFAWFPNNRVMRDAGLIDERADALRYLARCSAAAAYDETSPTLGLPERQYRQLEAFYDNAAPAFDFVTEAGVQYIQAETLPDYYSHLPENKAPLGRCFMPGTDAGEIGWGNDTVAQLRRAVESRGGKLLTGHRVRQLVYDGDAVVGVVADTDDGTVVVRARRGVVFASGGFAQNKELRAELLAGPIFGACAAHSNTGDLIQIATELGLPLRNTSWGWMTPLILERALRNDDGFQTTFAPPGDSMLYVNRYGVRTMDEKIPYNEATQSYWRWNTSRLEWSDLLQFMIWDQECQDRYHSDVPANPIATRGVDDGHVVTGATMEELVAALRARVEQLSPTTGVRLDDSFEAQLSATIVRFNAMAASGKDEDFGRGELPIEHAFNTWFGEPRPDAANDLLYPLTATGPYYATIMAPGLLDTKGGPVTDETGQILDAHDEPVPGLYGAGNCVASPSGKAYWAAGATIGPAITFGYVAGGSAAAAPVREFAAAVPA